LLEGGKIMEFISVARLDPLAMISAHRDGFDV
jgi:hypothetical protein